MQNCNSFDTIKKQKHHRSVTKIHQLCKKLKISHRSDNEWVTILQQNRIA